MEKPSYLMRGQLIPKELYPLYEKVIGIADALHDRLEVLESIIHNLNNKMPKLEPQEKRCEHDQPNRHGWVRSVSSAMGRAEEFYPKNVFNTCPLCHKPAEQAQFTGQHSFVPKPEARLAEKLREKTVWSFVRDHPRSVPLWETTAEAAVEEFEKLIDEMTRIDGEIRLNAKGLKQFLRDRLLGDEK